MPSQLDVYNPTDDLEKAIQQEYHKSTNEWLKESNCKLIAKSVASLKWLKEDWLNNPRLLESRISYLFNDLFARNRKTILFPTYPVFVRDILENGKIDIVLHGPITFVTRQVYHYLLTEYPVALIFDFQMLKSQNKHTKLYDFGTLIGGYDDNIVFDDSTIVQILVRHNKMDASFQSLLHNLGHIPQVISKSAAKQYGENLFKLDKDETVNLTGQQVVNKSNKLVGTIELFEPDESGMIFIRQSDGTLDPITKEVFNKEYVISS